MSESNDEPDTERVGVRTYIPTYQREAWREHAEELGMSQSEFVRVMVQAGRRGFDLGGTNGSNPSNPVEGGSPDATPGGEGLEAGILELLEQDGPLGWDELVEGLTGDLEAQIEDSLDQLQTANRVKYSGRAGGYVVDR